MRVLIAGHSLGEIGGVQRYERDLASWLLANGHSPVVYATATATYAVIKSNAAAGCPAGQTGTLRAVKITTGAPPTMEVAWCSGAASAGAPAVTMSNASGTDTLVWLIGDDNKLRAHDGDTGAVVFNGGPDTMASGSPFRSPS